MASTSGVYLVNLSNLFKLSTYQTFNITFRIEPFENFEKKFFCQKNFGRKIFQVWSHDDVIKGKSGRKFFMRFLHELKSLDSKKAIKKFSTKIWIIHKVWSILAIFDPKNHLDG